MDFGHNDKHILLIIHACTDDNTLLINKAQHLLVSSQTHQFSLLLVVPKIPTYAYQFPSIQTMQYQFLEQGKQKMAHIADLFGITKAHQLISFGSINREIELINKEQPIDEIISDSDEDKATFADEIYAMLGNLSHEPRGFWARFFTSYFATR